MLTFSNNRLIEVREVRRKNVDWKEKYYHYCASCGRYSREKLPYFHPTKARLICRECHEEYVCLCEFRRRH